MGLGQAEGESSAAVKWVEKMQLKRMYLAVETVSVRWRWATRRRQDFCSKPMVADWRSKSQRGHQQHPPLHRSPLLLACYRWRVVPRKVGGTTG